MVILQSLFGQLSAERVGWFGAGLSAAALGLVGYQVLLGAALSGALPGPQPTLGVAVAASPTRTPYPTHTPRPTPTSFPTATPRPSPTPFPTRSPRPSSTPFPTRMPRATSVPLQGRSPTPVSVDLLATVTFGDPGGLTRAVVTFAAVTAAELEKLAATPGAGAR